MVESKIKDYLFNLPDKIFPQRYFLKSSVFLSGSIGWGIKTDTDTNVDWDLSILLDNDTYTDFVSEFGKDYVIDDHSHKPDVFGQIRSYNWVKKRIFSNNRKWWPLYFWIFKYGKWIIEKNNVKDLIKEGSIRFNEMKNKLLQEHYITFCVRKCDLKSSTNQNIFLASHFYHTECVLAALRTFCLANEEPYPYNKWISKFVITLKNGEEFNQLCKKSIDNINNFSEKMKSIKEIEKFLILLIQKKIGDKKWLYEWWKFNDN